jgi:hypothetical protein
MKKIFVVFILLVIGLTLLVLNLNKNDNNRNQNSDPCGEACDVDMDSNETADSAADVK